MASNEPVPGPHPTPSPGSPALAPASKLEIRHKRGTPGAADSWWAFSTYEGGNYCGPQWGFTYKDILDGKLLPEAVDAIDQACKAHDECYEDNGYMTAGCNLVLAKNLYDISRDPNSTPQQKTDAIIMAAIFAGEGLVVDPLVLQKKNTKAFRDTVGGLFRKAGYTMQQSVNRAIMFLDEGVNTAVRTGR